MIETLAAVLGDVRLSFRSLWRSKVLTLAVVTTLALGIGANAAMFTLVRGVLLRPLVNREENRLIYLRQTAPGLSPGPVPFSVPEIQDLRASVKTVGALGEFSTVGFTCSGWATRAWYARALWTATILKSWGCAPAAHSSRRFTGNGWSSGTRPREIWR